MTFAAYHGGSTRGERATVGSEHVTRADDHSDQARPSGPGAGTGAAEALHDVSNALTVVLGWLEEAARDDVGADELRRAIAIATRKAREARALSREAIGASPRRDVSRPIAEIFGEVVDALQVECARAGVTIAMTGDESSADVRGASALGHVATNLLLNAIAFSPAGSTIRVDFQVDAQQVRVVVEDQGPGVDPQIADLLFDGRSSRPGGAGIGLRHARDMTRRLGGDLSHRDFPSAEARGARFELRLPRHVSSSASETPRPPERVSANAPTSLRGTRVLVLEDDRSVCALLDAGLGARGIEVIAVHDERSLRERLPTVGAIDAVLLDLSPIAHDVQGSITALRKALPDAGIVFISGSALALEEDLVRGDGRTRWVRKPFELSEITQAIAEILLPRVGARSVGSE